MSRRHRTVRFGRRCLAATDGLVLVPLRLRGGVLPLDRLRARRDLWRAASSELCTFMPWRGIADGPRPSHPAEVRVAELVATLSYAVDLGLGQPMEHCLRQTVNALPLAEPIGATAQEGLMMTVYCHPMRTSTSTAIVVVRPWSVSW